MRTLSLLAVVALIAVSASAQTSPCSSLSITGTLTPGATIVISLTGSLADAPTVLAVGETPGSTMFNFGLLGGFTLGLDAPFIILPFDFTDTNGDASVSIGIPATATIPTGIPPTTLHLQAVSFDFSFGGGLPSISFCTSNVATFSI